MALRIKPVNFHIVYYRDADRKGTVMVADPPDAQKRKQAKPRPGWREQLPPEVEVEVLPDATVSRPSDVIALREGLEPDVDAILLSGTTDEVLWARVCDLGIPLLFPEFSGPNRSFMDGGEWEYYMPDREVGFAALIAALALRKKLGDMNALYIGEIPSISVFASSWDLEAIRARIGVNFVQVEGRELIEFQRQVSDDEGEKVLARWEEVIANLVEPTREEVLDVAKLYFAFRQLLEREEATGLAINCGRTTEYQFTTPCFAMAMLIDEGIASACEADTNAMLAMKCLMELTHGPALMGNFRVWPEEKQVSIHHDVIPRGMVSGPFDMFGFHYRDMGVTGYADLRQDEVVTIAGISRDLNEMMVTTGIVRSSENMVHCRLRAFIDVEDPEAIRYAQVGHHHSMAYGDVREEVKALGKVLGLEVHSV
jgi:hypothetical protein